MSIDVCMTLQICPNSFSICKFISLIPVYVCLNMCTHFPPLPYSYTFIAVFICMVCVLFYIHNHLFLFLISCSMHLIDTYVTVPIDVRMILLISLDSFSIYIFIPLNPANVTRVLARIMLEDWETEPAVYDDDQSETAPNCHPRRNRERFSTPHTARDPNKIQEVELESEDLQGMIRQPPKVGSIRFHHEPESSNTSHADVTATTVGSRETGK